MKVLWDLRLFSHGYAHRGVGSYTARVATAILDAYPEMTFFIWGDRDVIPEQFHRKNVKWIPYADGTWKSSVAVVPYIAVRYGINLIHYWAALGPVHHIGIAPVNMCKTVATIYDAGVELWDVPYLRHVRTTPYWRMQKIFFEQLDGIMAISRSTLDAIGTFLPLHDKITAVVYPPAGNAAGVMPCQSQREKYFVTLGGSVHKNCRNVVDAFAQVRKKHSGYTLLILGQLHPEEEHLTSLPEGVSHEPSMERYAWHLSRCSGLIFCSRHEGLGLPPLEAMPCGCPLLLSSIPALQETCAGSAMFAAPDDCESIASGIETLIVDNKYWQERSLRGAVEYDRMSRSAVSECMKLYESVMGR